MSEQKESIFSNYEIMYRALKDSFIKPNPRTQTKNPVMFMVFMSAILIFAMFLFSLAGVRDAAPGYILTIFVTLWFTVSFGNFTKTITEGKGKAQADALCTGRENTMASRVPSADRKNEAVRVKSTELKKGDFVYIKAGEQIPADGDAVEDVAPVDESAITGESAPVIRENGSDRNAVTGGTTAIPNWIVMWVGNNPGKGSMDKMIAMVEGASCRKTPNELTLQTSLVALSVIFVLATMSLYSYSIFSSVEVGAADPASVTNLVAFSIYLAPTTVSALSPAISIMGIGRLNQANVLAVSGRTIETAGNVDTLLLDKTSTITFGNRQADAFISVDGHKEMELVDVAQLSSLAGETPEGRNIMVLAEECFGIRARNMEEPQASFVPFTAEIRMSGIDYNGNEIRKGVADAIRAYVDQYGGASSEEYEDIVKRIVNQGGTPLVVAKNERVMGVVELKGIMKQSVKEKFADLRKTGIRAIMTAGDNPLTAASIAAEAGVDDSLAEVTPGAKLDMMQDYQVGGRPVAMTGDGTNGAPALAQTDVAVTMNTGTQATKETGNMVDPDSSPTKLIEIVKIDKQLLITRGSLTTFSIANDVAKYFTIIPALFMGLYPGLPALDTMGLRSTNSAAFSTIVHNALTIVVLIPLVLKGVGYKEVSAAWVLSGNLLIYGLGGIIIPFIAIRVIDVPITTVGLVVRCVEGVDIDGEINQS